MPSKPSLPTGILARISATMATSQSPLQRGVHQPRGSELAWLPQ